MRRGVWAVLGALVVGLVAVVALWRVADRGPLAELTAEPVTVHDAEAGRLDTLRLRGRAVTASVDGTVIRARPDGRVRLDLGDGPFTLDVPGGDSLAAGDRLLAVGRVREGRGRRWIDVEAWSTVTYGLR